MADRLEELKIEDLDEEKFSELAEKVQGRSEAARLAKKQQRIEKEREQVLKEVEGAAPVTQRGRVAYLLNHYPETRDSDIKLSLLYWQKFQPEHYAGGHIRPGQLFKLERQTAISRLRAKIQNDFGLFRGTEEVQRKRRQREEKFRDDMVADKPVSRSITVFVDETGKTGTYAGVGSVWYLDPMAPAKFQLSVTELCRERRIKGEFHFSRLSQKVLDSYEEFVRLAAKNGEFSSFKAVVAKIAGTTRKQDEAIRHLLRILLSWGYAQEIESRRATAPRTISVTLDDGTFWDGIARQTIQEAANAEIQRRFGPESSIDRISVVPSHDSALVQLADLFTGAVNRKFNAQVGPRSLKDDFAEFVLKTLAPNIESVSDNDSLEMFDLQ